MSEVKAIKSVGLRKVIDTTVDPFLEFGRAMGVWSQPALLVARIKAGQVSAGSLVGFVVVASILSAVIEKVVPDGTVGFDDVFGLPIIATAVYLLVLVLAGTATGILLFLPIRWLGGNGSFRHTLMATVYATAALSPIFTLANGLVWQVAHVALSHGFGAVVTFCYYQQVLPALHETSRIRTGIAQVLTFVAVIAVTFIVILVAKG